MTSKFSRGPADVPPRTQANSELQLTWASLRSAHAAELCYVWPDPQKVSSRLEDSLSSLVAAPPEPLFVMRSQRTACTLAGRESIAMALLYERPFTDDFVLEFSKLALEIFGNMDTEDLAWRLAAMPDATVHATRLEGRLVAFKFGYAVERKRYLSWLGGVSLDQRRKGLARDLMKRQHHWAHRHGYEYIETGAIKFNTAMLTLNLSVGFEIIGTYARTEIPRVVMQKRLSDSAEPD